MSSCLITQSLFGLQALTCVRVEASTKLSQAILEERSQKDIAMQQVLAQARANIPATLNIGSERLNDVTLLTDGKNTYSVQFLDNVEQSAAVGRESGDE